jgi:hypothetical protein
VLSAIEEDLFAPAIMNAAIARAIEIVLAEGDREPDTFETGKQLADVEQQIRTLATSLAAGAGDVAGLVQTLTKLEARRRSLTSLTSRTPRQRAAASSGRAIERQLRTRLEAWRDLLRSNINEARPVLESLLDGRIQITPRIDTPTHAPTFDVRIPLAMSGMFEGMCFPTGVASPAGTAQILRPEFRLFLPAA